MTASARPSLSPARSAPPERPDDAAAPIVRDGAPDRDRLACDAVRFPHDAGRGTNAGDTPMVPIVIEGIDPPWLLDRACRTTQPLPDGYQPWIAVVGGEDSEWRRASERCDLAPILADGRVHVFRGDAAVADFEAFLHARLDTRLNCSVHILPGRRAAAGPTVADVVRAAMARQQAEHLSLAARVDSIYAGRDARWWAGRYATAVAKSPGAAPLRVLLITSRYTTFVQHAMGDLALAFQAAGCEARVLMEPDDHSRLVTVAYLREFASFQPDLVVAANFARPHLGAACARNVPFVCWIQDTLAHLFDSRVGAALGPLDFTFGNAMQALHLHHGWPARTMRHWPVAASPRRFHAAPVDASRRVRFECDIAYVSHHSEPPERLVQGVIAQFPAGSPMRRAIEHAAPGIAALVADGPDGAFDERQWSARAKPVLDAALAANPGATLDRSRFWALVAGPMIERLVRRQTLRWTVDLARRRGLALRIYGRGWETDEEFAPFAAGPVEPGEDLRACYQCAGLHLHMSANTGAHQRVYECALSGGLMLRRLCPADLEAYEEELARRAIAALGERLPRSGPVSLAPANVPDLDELNAWRASLGLPARTELSFDADRAARLRVRVPTSIDRFPDRLLPRSEETLFWSRVTLESRIALALSDAAWRERTIRAHAAAAAQGATTDALAADLLGFVRASLGAAAPTTPAATPAPTPAA